MPALSLRSPNSTIRYRAKHLRIIKLTVGRVIFKAHFRHFVFRIDCHFQGVHSGLYVRDVDPLAVHGVFVDVRAIHRYTLVAIVGTGIARLNSGKALVIF